MKVLAIHQGNELYGSDRSFALSVNSFLSADNIKVDVFLPSPGKIQSIIDSNVNSYGFDNSGILRKYSLKKAPIQSLSGLFLSFFRYVCLFRKYDFVYINTIVCLSAILATYLHRRKKIFIHVREIPQGRVGKIFRFFLKYSGAHLIFNSRATKQNFELPGDVLHNAYEPDFDSPHPANNKNLSDFKTKKLLLIGRVNDWKGQDFFLESLREFDLAADIEVDILGDVFKDQHHLMVNLESIADSISTKVNFHGFQSEPSQYFYNSQFTVVPSLRPEPFGRVAIESLYHGRPVLAANHGGLSEIVEDGVTGFLFEPGDSDSLRTCLSRLLSLSDKEYLAMCGKCSEVFDQKYSRDVYQRNLLNLMELR
ncbi:MAG: glycosyltransferase family 4 protein [Pseudoalteromonas sp.]|nr:glycosyltransferase family 4 protein [Pseudoalteromonas sp.]